MIWLEIKLLIELQEPQKLYHRIIKLQIKKKILDFIEKYIKKDVFWTKTENYSWSKINIKI